MKRKRFLRTQRLPILAALIVALAAVGLTAFVASAGADFTIRTGRLQLTNGSTSGSPPSSGSWVELLNKDPGGSPFINPASTAANLALTLINGTGAEGLLFGTAQPGGGIFGPLTYFGQTLQADLFSALTLPGSSPFLTFSGAHNATGSRELLGGNLLGLDIEYAGGLYRVGTEFGATGGDIVQSLTGLIHGNILSTTNPATILLNWITSLLEPGFSLYNAQFHWVGTYHQ
jgi:hypothetical protein